MKDNLLIVGEGQYGLIAKEMAESMGSFEKVSFLDCGENSESIESELELLSTENKYAFAAFAGAEARVEFTRMSVRPRRLWTEPWRSRLP